MRILSWRPFDRMLDALLMATVFVSLIWIALFAAILMLYF